MIANKFKTERKVLFSARAAFLNPNADFTFKFYAKNKGNALWVAAEILRGNPSLPSVCDIKRA